MRIPERDVIYIVLSVYSHLSTATEPEPVPLLIKWIIPKLTQL